MDSTSDRENVVMNKEDVNLNRKAKKMGAIFKYEEKIKNDFEWFPASNVSKFVHSEWIIDGEYRDDDGSILPLRIRKLALKDTNLYAIWTRHGIQVFNKPSLCFEIRTLRTPSLVYRLQRFMQSQDERRNEIKSEEKDSAKGMKRSDVLRETTSKEVRPRRELRYVLKHLDDVDIFETSYKFELYRIFEECANTMFEELKPFTTWGLHHESINEGLKEAHKVFVLLPWEFHLIFGGPWLSRGNVKKENQNSLANRIRREAEIECDNVLRSKLKLKNQKCPITIEIRKEENCAQKYDEIWSVRVTARAMFLVEFATNILLKEFSKRTSMLKYKFEDEADYNNNHGRKRHHSRYYHDIPTCVPLRKCIVRTERCDVEGHEEGKCRVSRIMSDGTYIVMHNHRGSKSLSHKVKRYDIFTTPKLSRKDKIEIISMMHTKVEDQAKLTSKNSFDNRENIARSAFYLYKINKINKHVYSRVLARLFTFLNVPLSLRMLSAKDEAFNSKDEEITAQKMFDTVYVLHGEENLGTIIRTPILYSDDIGSFCARLKIQSDKNAKVPNEMCDVFLSLEKILSVEDSSNASTQRFLPQDLAVHGRTTIGRLRIDDLYQSKTLNEQAKIWNLYTGSSEKKSWSFLEICALLVDWSHVMKSKQLTAYFVRSTKVKRGMSNLQSSVKSTETFVSSSSLSSFSLTSSMREKKNKDDDHKDMDKSVSRRDTMREELQEMMKKLMNLASMKRVEMVKEARSFGIRVERNDSIESISRKLNTKLEKSVLLLRSKLIRRHERQSVDLVLADDKSAERILVGNLVRVFFDGEIESKTWKKGRLLAINSDDTCLVRTRQGNKLSEDIVPRSHIKPWHSAMFIKIKMKGSHFLNSSKPQLGVSALKISQRQFHPDEGPHSFDDQCWNQEGFRSLLRKIPRPSSSQIMTVMYEKEKLMSGYRSEENKFVDIENYVSMGYSSWLMSTMSNSRHSNDDINKTMIDQTRTNNLFKRMTLKNSFWRKTEALKHPRGIAMGRRSRDINVGLCKATKCILDGTLLKTLQVPGRGKSPPSRHDCLSDSTRMTLAIPFTQVPGFNVMEAKLSIIDLMSKSSKMESFRGRCQDSPLPLPVVVVPNLPEIPLEKCFLKHFRVSIRLWQDSLNASKRKFVTSIKSRSAASSIIAYDRETSRVTTKKLDLDWVSGDRVVVSWMDKDPSSTRQDDKICHDDDLGLSWYAYEIEEIQDNEIILSPTLKSTYPPMDLCQCVIHLRSEFYDTKIRNVKSTNRREDFEKNTWFDHVQQSRSVEFSKYFESELCVLLQHFENSFDRFTFSSVSAWEASWLSIWERSIDDEENNDEENDDDDFDHPAFVTDIMDGEMTMESLHPHILEMCSGHIKRKENKKVMRFFETNPHIARAENAMISAKRVMMNHQRALQEFLGETSVSSSAVYPADPPIGDHANMETVARQQNRVVDTIHRGLCNLLEVPFDAVSMSLETPSVENLDLYVERVRSWRRTILKSRLPVFQSSFVFEDDNQVHVEEKDWDSYERFALNELRPGTSIRYWWGLFSSSVLHLVRLEEPVDYSSSETNMSGSKSNGVINVTISNGPGRWVVRFERTNELQSINLMRKKLHIETDGYFRTMARTCWTMGCFGRH